MDDNKDILKALEYFGFDEEEADSLIKSISKSDDEDKEDMTVTDKEDMEKSKVKKSEDVEEEKEEKEDEYSDEDLEKAKTAMEDLEKSYKEKKDLYESMCSKKGTDMKKSETVEEKEDNVEDLFKSLMADVESKNKEREDELLKAITGMEDTISEMSERLEKTEKQYEGRKTVTNRDYLKKSMTDEEGYEIVSITQNKQGTIDSLEKGMRSAGDEELKKSYSECLINFNMGSAAPTRDVADDLFKSHNIRLVK